MTNLRDIIDRHGLRDTDDASGRLNKEMADIAANQSEGQSPIHSFAADLRKIFAARPSLDMPKIEHPTLEIPTEATLPYIGKVLGKIHGTLERQSSVGKWILWIAVITLILVAGQLALGLWLGWPQLPFG